MCWTRPVNRGGVATEPQGRSSCPNTALMVVITLVALAAIVYGSIGLHNEALTWRAIAVVAGGGLALIVEGALCLAYRRTIASKAIHKPVPQSQLPQDQPLPTSDHQRSTQSDLPKSDDTVPLPTTPTAPKAPFKLELSSIEDNDIIQDCGDLQAVLSFLQEEDIFRGSCVTIVRDNQLPKGDQDYEWCRLCFLEVTEADKRTYSFVFYKRKGQDDFTFFQSDNSGISRQIDSIITRGCFLKDFISDMTSSQHAQLCKVTQTAAPLHVPTPRPNPPQIVANKPFTLAKTSLQRIEECGPFCINFQDQEAINKAFNVVGMTITGEEDDAKEKRFVWLANSEGLYQVVFQRDKGSTGSLFTLASFTPKEEYAFQLSNGQIGKFTLDEFVKQHKNKFCLYKLKPACYKE